MFLYFIQAGGPGGPIKVGHSRDVNKRLSQLQTGNHLPLQVVAAMPFEDAAERENNLHWLLSDYRIEGEWFSVSELIKNVIIVSFGESFGLHAFARQFPSGLTL